MITLANQLNSINLILYASSDGVPKDIEINNQLKYLDNFTSNKFNLEQLVESQNIWNVRIKDISKFILMFIDIDEYLKTCRFNTFNIKNKTSNLPTNEIFHYAEYFNSQLVLFNRVISSCQFIYDGFDSNFEISKL
ncbi:hypothetical protein ND446_04875 [Yersinia ruckeri]|uniref:hypothetical protein n=1 Tax=Yersinia ruckeri TaxID=29486 RepID=UPI0022641ED7|nr:hypothetical protein [Yersinia ruckeri]UZX56247.1 hypothetical protein ND446_04875 [Yersinia ruckeri]